ncbi:MAG: NAD+ synthase [Chloroflexota bacterium]|nr:MAG: NAD+ synthase [Chloroflexota bacterium]
MSKLLADEITRWIARRVDEAHSDGVMVGLSGGIDSAVVAVLAQRALGENVLTLIMPCHSDPADEQAARLVVDKFGLKMLRVELTPAYDALLSILPEGNALAKANLKPRLRMATLYYHANTHNYLVAGTGNKSELMVGYFTKWGDGGVDILPIGSLLKTQVREVARAIDIPQEIIDRPPSAGLWQGQTDESEMGISYADLDQAILAMESAQDELSNAQALSRLRQMHARSQHKRAPVQIFERTDPQAK